MSMFHKRMETGEGRDPVRLPLILLVVGIACYGLLFALNAPLSVFSTIPASW